MFAEVQKNRSWNCWRKTTKLLIRHLHVSSWFSYIFILFGGGERERDMQTAGSKYGHHGKRDVIIARHQQSETTMAGISGISGIQKMPGMHGRRSRFMEKNWPHCFMFGDICRYFAISFDWNQIFRCFLMLFFGQMHEIRVFPLVVCFLGKMYCFQVVYLKVAEMLLFFGRHVGPTRRRRPSWNERSCAKAQWMPTLASSIPSSTLVPRTETGV